MPQKTKRKILVKSKKVRSRGKKTRAKKTQGISQFKDRFAEYAKKVIGETKQRVKEIFPQKAVRNWQNKFKIQHKESREGAYHLPGAYGENKLVLLVRDPHWLFSYWEITLAKIQALREKIGKAFSENNLILRIFQERPHKYFDINVRSAGISGSWYVNVGLPDTTFKAQIGYLTLDGQFYPLVTSNIVRTPRDRVSDVIDEEWMIPDWEKLFTLSGGYAARRGSEEISEMLSKYITEARSSEAVSSFSRAIQK